MVIRNFFNGEIELLGVEGYSQGIGRPQSNHKTLYSVWKT